MTAYADSPVGTVRAVPLRFVDGDAVRSPQGETWRRGLRVPGTWERFPSPEQAVRRSDESIRALLGEEAVPGWTFTPHLPAITAPLPGTACVTRGVRDLRLSPASGASLYAARLDRALSFFGNDQGVFGDSAVRLRLADLRATLEGVLTRYPGSKVTYHRVAGRVYARYATSSTLRTHVLVLTR